MAEFTADFHSLMDPRLFDYSMSFQTNFSLSDPMFCADRTPENPRNPEEIFPESNQILQPILSNEIESYETRKRRAIDEQQTSSAIKTPQASENGIKRKKLLKTGRGGKREKSDEREEEKPGEIVLVRARRGQATDSHSLAERVRREKINERLRCLQDIVPGCYKSMGMAVMLDEIINYVQSLQNQVEFLSMKLASASSFNGRNSVEFASQNAPRWFGSGGDESKELERLMREGCGTLACFQSSWPF